MERRNLDDAFTLQAIDPILEKLGDSKISFYLVGEIAEWYPEIPQKIIKSGHELGLHCQFHRSLVSMAELASDIRASASWVKDYGVRGYRAPMVGMSEAAYSLLEESGFQYSSSIYAPAGTLLQKGNVWEIPVSTMRLGRGEKRYTAPRQFTWSLLLNGEYPYGSSFSIGLMGKTILYILERELKKGFSPVLFMHPYELISPAHWASRTWRDVLSHPLLWPFTWNKSEFFSALLRNFSVSPIGTYLNDALRAGALA
ncbi:MAG TPA: polysaccharide deacetylase family protein [Anaerolineales bacterium]|nr:polysaccharide deacetylase family protein [Anaerolineales bacterium]